MAKWESYKGGIDVEALAWMAGQTAADAQADEGSTARVISLPDGAVNFNMGTLVGSCVTIARLLDEAAGVAGTQGIMLVFDDFLEGLERFGTRIQPLMRSRGHVTVPLAEVA